MLKDLYPIGRIDLHLNSEEWDMVNTTSYALGKPSASEKIKLPHRSAYTLCMQDMSVYPQFDRNDNIAIGRSVSQYRDQMLTLAEKKGIDLIKAAKGQQDFPEDIRKLYLSMHLQSVKLVLGNWKIVRSHVNVMVKKAGRDNVDKADMFQNGIIGLYFASARYDPWHKVEGKKTLDNAIGLYTYAKPWIESYITRGHSDDDVLLRSTQISTFNKFRKGQISSGELSEYGNSALSYHTAYLADSGISITEDAVDKHLKRIDKDPEYNSCFVRFSKRLENILNAANIPRLHDIQKTQRIVNGDVYFRDYELVETIPDPGPGIEEVVECNELKNLIADVINGLPEKEAKALRFRMGFENGSKMTYKEVAENMGITAQAVRKIIDATLRKLRSTSVVFRLRDYLDNEIYQDTQDK
jgi:RNA polymerase sigma factor (sigma-70 family)